MAGLPRLTRRAEYLDAAKGFKAPRPSVLVQGRRLATPEAAAAAGFTATKKIGNAVVRNRARRRLKEAARLLLPQFGRSGAAYVFIARDTTATAEWACLLDDVKSALIRLGAQLDAGSPPARSSHPPFTPRGADASSGATPAPQTPNPKTEEPC